MRRKLALNLVTVTACGFPLLAGCTVVGRHLGPVSAADPAGGPSQRREAAQRSQSPTTLSLFGDNPEHEHVPFENRLVTNMAQHTFTTEGLDFDPVLDPTGETLLFASTRNAQRPDLFLKRVDGSALTQLTGDPADDIQPRFSPDGQCVVFSSNRGGNWDVWMIQRDGTGLTQFTQDRSDEVAPCWSPDGSQVAYTVWGSQSHRWEIWTLDVEKPGVRRFLAYGMFPEWSPDGTRVAFQRARQRGSRWFSVWIIDLVDGEARHPTEVAYSDTDACIAPCWAPDGSMIVYCSVHPDSAPVGPENRVPTLAELWAIDLESGLRMKLTDESAAAFNPVWSPDGRVFFVSARGGTENIWSLTAELVAYTPTSDGEPQVSQARGEQPDRGPSE